MPQKREKPSTRSQLNRVADAVSALETAQQRLREAEIPECADVVRNVLEQARAEFIVHWEMMLRAEGRWRDDEGSQRMQMALARVYLGGI